MTFYVNGDTHEVYTEAEVREAYTEAMAQLLARGDGGVTFDQWIEDQRDLDLLVVDIDDVGRRHRPSITLRVAPSQRRPVAGGRQRRGCTRPTSKCRRRPTRRGRRLFYVALIAMLAKTSGQSTAMTDDIAD